MPNDEKVNILLIGCGKWARDDAHLPAIEAARGLYPHVRLVAVADRADQRQVITRLLTEETSVMI
jgi:predicted dehydrogenase